MSSPFYTIAKRKIKPIVEPLGFRSYNRFFYRVVNDVVQQFCLLSMSDVFTIRVLLSSVYTYSNSREDEGIEIGALLDEDMTARWGGGWFGHKFEERDGCRYMLTLFQGTKEEIMTQKTDLSAELVSTVLLPWFAEAESSAAAYASAKSTGAYQYNPISTDERGAPDSFSMLGFLLGMEEWQRAAELIEWGVERWGEDFAMRSPTYYGTLCRALREGDVAYVRRYMAERKEETYTALKWK